jgi:PilZ domain-containing protein
MSGCFGEAIFMIERRMHGRHQVFKFGMLTYRCLAKLGVVKNISPSGAMLAVENSIGVPDDLSLNIEASLFNGPCHVVWKNAKEIGVRFTKSVD